MVQVGKASTQGSLHCTHTVVDASTAAPNKHLLLALGEHKSIPYFSTIIVNVLKGQSSGIGSEPSVAPVL